MHKREPIVVCWQARNTIAQSKNQSWLLATANCDDAINWARIFITKSSRFRGAAVDWHEKRKPALFGYAKTRARFALESEASAFRDSISIKMKSHQRIRAKITPRLFSRNSTNAFLRPRVESRIPILEFESTRRVFINSRSEPRKKANADYGRKKQSIKNISTPKRKDNRGRSKM